MCRHRDRPALSRGGQLCPERTRFLEPIRECEQPRECDPCAVAVPGASPEFDCAVEQVVPDASGLPERELGERREARGEELRLGELLGKLERFVGMANALEAASPCGRHPRKAAEDLDSLLGREARLGQRALPEALGDGDSFRLDVHRREPAECLASDRAGVRRADRLLEQRGGSRRVARMHGIARRP